MTSAHRTALRLAGVYMLAGLAWIVLSDSAVLEYSRDSFLLVSVILVPPQRYWRSVFSPSPIPAPV